MKNEFGFIFIFGVCHAIPLIVPICYHRVMKSCVFVWHFQLSSSLTSQLLQPCSKSSEKTNGMPAMVSASLFETHPVLSSKGRVKKEIEVMFFMIVGVFSSSTFTHVICRVAVQRFVRSVRSLMYYVS